MKSLGWLTGCALALACAHEGKSVVRESDTKMQGTGAGEASQPQADSMAYASNQKESRKESATAGAAIRPFNVKVPESALVDLRQRIAATRWPERETVPDRSQGVQLEKLQALVRDWGKAEAKLDALPQFMTRSMASTFTSSTSALVIRMPCRSSSPMAGRGPS